MRKTGRIDYEANLPAEVNTLTGTFRISVKDDNGEVQYQNDAEPFEYHEVPSLETALKYFGATLTDDQTQFLTEALQGSEETGKAVKEIIDTINDSLKNNAKSNAYQRVFNAHKPLTEENIMNAHASIVRNFIKTSNVSDETAVETLKAAKVLPDDFTVEDFRSNKGKR